MPPRVLPVVATARAGQNEPACCFSTPNSTASDPPGRSVAARKLAMNKAQRLVSSGMIGCKYLRAILRRFVRGGSIASVAPTRQPCLQGEARSGAETPALW